MGQMPLGWSMILLVRNAFQASPDLCYLASGQTIWEVLPEVNWMAWYQVTPFTAGKPTLRHAFLREYFYVSALKWKAVLKAVTRCYHGYAENTGISDSVFLFTNTVITNNEFSGHFIFFILIWIQTNHMQFLFTYFKTTSRSFPYFIIKALKLCYILEIDWIGRFFFSFCFCSFVWQLSPNLAFGSRKKNQPHPQSPSVTFDSWNRPFWTW